MIKQDQKEKERSEAKNSVEEFIYAAREKLSSEDEKYIQGEVSTLFSSTILLGQYLYIKLSIFIKEQNCIFEIIG